MHAKVTQSPLRTDWFDVVLTVETTDRKRPQLGNVVFHLHPTFKTPRTRLAVNGQAMLSVIAWGAFSVGGEAYEGRTRLELNLARVADAPLAFRQL